MVSATGRRVLATLGFLAIGLLLAPAQARGVAPADQIGLRLEDALVPVSTTAKSATITLTNTGTGDVELHHVRLVVDGTGLTGIAGIQSPLPSAGGQCTTAGATITCTYDRITVSIINAYPLHMDLKAVGGATAGQQGGYRVTVQADELPARSAEARVTLAEGVNLVAGPTIALSGPPGATLPLTPSVRNAGATVVHGAVLSSSSGSHSGTYQPKYSNCEYTAVEFFCVFDDDLAPGREYAPAEPISVVVTTDAPAPSTFDTYAEWQTTDDAPKWIEAVRRRGAKPASGPTLRLVERAAQMRSNAAQTDVSGIDDFTQVVVNVTGQNLPDPSAVGTTVRGSVGQTVTARVGVKNLGPARMDVEVHGYPGVVIVVPPGTTVVSVDGRNCVPSKDGVPDRTRTELLGATEYRCLTFDIPVGKTATWDVGLRIDDATPSTGTITTRTDTVDPAKVAVDRDPANNTAAILVNPPGGATDSPGAILPVTGTGIGLLAGGGLTIAALGTGAYLLARRRRTRFVA